MTPCQPQVSQSSEVARAVAVVRSSVHANAPRPRAEYEKVPRS